MGAALSGLTLRGRCLLAAGIAASLCAVALGEEDLLRVGIFLVALPLVAVAAVARTRYRLTCERRLDPARVAAGVPATVRLRLHNVSRLPTGVLLVEDTLPWALGERPRFVVDRMEPEGVRDVSYPVLSHSRGRFRIGPLTVRLTDPFGLCELTRSFRAHDTLMVTPAVVPLPAVRIGGDRAGGGDGRERSVAVHGEDDVAVRDYRQGDDLRRVHWRSTARTGELMVRREEQPWHSRCTLFVDNRVCAHRGRGTGSSLEAAVVATASVAVHLAGQGYQVRLVSATGEQLGRGWHDGGDSFDAQHLLEQLAVLPAVEAGALVTDWVDDTVTGGMFVGVLGAFDDHDRAFFARIHSPGGTPYAIVLDVPAWAAGRRTPGPLGAETASRTSWLQSHGWKATALGLRTPLATAWQELGR